MNTGQSDGSRTQTLIAIYLPFREEPGCALGTPPPPKFFVIFAPELRLGLTPSIYFPLLRINLAYQELYLVIAGVFRKYDLYDPKREGQGPSLALYDTVRERDVDMSADLALPVPALGSKGVRIQVR